MFGVEKRADLKGNESRVDGIGSNGGGVVVYLRFAGIFASLFHFSRWCYGPPSSHPPVNILLFLFGRFQNLAAKSVLLKRTVQ